MLGGSKVAAEAEVAAAAAAAAFEAGVFEVAARSLARGPPRPARSSERVARITGGAQEMGGCRRASGTCHPHVTVNIFSGHTEQRVSTRSVRQDDLWIVVSS